LAKVQVHLEIGWIQGRWRKAYSCWNKRHKHFFTSN